MKPHRLIQSEKPHWRIGNLPVSQAGGAEGSVWIGGIVVVFPLKILGWWKVPCLPDLKLPWMNFEVSSTLTPVPCKSTLVPRQQREEQLQRLSQNVTRQEGIAVNAGIVSIHLCWIKDFSDLVSWFGQRGACSRRQELTHDLEHLEMG